jgi:hypothetical protein
MDLKVRSVSARRHAHGLIADVILQCPKTLRALRVLRARPLLLLRLKRDIFTYARGL